MELASYSVSLSSSYGLPSGLETKLYTKKATGEFIIFKILFLDRRR